MAVGIIVGYADAYMPILDESLLPTGVCTAGTSIENGQGRLYPDEREYIRTSNDTRRRQFTAGRSCAHDALRCLGISALPVLKGKHGEPLWPEGVIGSISHCHDYAAAAVALRRNYAGIGLDVEPAEPLDRDLRLLVCTAAELEMLGRTDIPDIHFWDRIIFSAKESVYKCIYPLAGVFLDFQDIEISFSGKAGQFHASVPAALPARSSLPHEYQGRYVVSSAHLFTALVLDAAALIR